MFFEGRFIRPFLISLVSALPVVGNAQTNPLLKVSFETFNYSEVTSLSAISGKWNDRVSNGNKALSVSRFIAGYEGNNYSLQTINRSDSYYRFNHETAWFIRLIENQIPLDTGRDYVLDIKPNRSSSKGFRVGSYYQFSEAFKLSGYFSLLNATNLLQGNLLGQASSISPTDYNFNFNSDLVYENDPLYGRSTNQVRGNGYAIDLIIDYSLSDNWHLNVQLLDLAGELSFDSVNHTQASATSAIKNFDENGYLQYDPVISGIEDNQGFLYKFDMQTQIAVTYHFSERKNIVLEYHQLFDFNYPKLILENQFEWGLLSWRLIPQLEAVGMGYQQSNFSVSIETDRIDFEGMKYLSIDLHYLWFL
ncbi:MAG: hypothetical protein ACI8XC_003933 [Gammaproteobacteria bacterium]|jgi:hypothetical protein